ncbi:MAG: hypothetical protein M1285_01745 [Candidatus Thermoplasmatota archaeon]|jgi:hypothetical protein|nr:hypothetical protein [Candidatus Thermoplasmatota archaeon]
MTIINLLYDQKKTLFSIPVLLMKKPNHRGVPTVDKLPTNGWCNTIMYLDTGSNLTSITENEVEKLNLDKSAFKNQRVGGIGGFIDTPITEEVDINVSSNDGKFLLVKLDKIAVHPTEIRKKVKKNYGGYVQRGNQTIEMICLFGLDALEKLGGVLEIDMRNKTGKINI